MADRMPASVQTFAQAVVDAFITQQAQIAELQTDRAALSDLVDKLSARIDALEGHAETVTGETGLTSQLGDLTMLGSLQERLAAAMPAPAEAEPATGAATGTAPEPANNAEPTAAAA